MLSPKLAAALQQAYQVFANLPRPAHLEAAPHRDGDRMLSSLTAAPLRELTGEQIGPYAGCAITTVGSERDYRHFLPRILELAVEGEVPVVTAGGTLHPAGVHDRPDAEGAVAVALQHIAGSIDN